LPESRFMRVYEIWQEVRGSHSLQVNDVMNAILELGLTTYTHLSPQMRHALFTHRSAREELKLQAVLEPRITRIASSLRADDRLTVRIPRHLKQLALGIVSEKNPELAQKMRENKETISDILLIDTVAKRTKEAA